PIARRLKRRGSVRAASHAGGSVLPGYGLVQPGGGVAVGRPGGPECLWLVSPQPQPGRVPDALVVSLGAAARALTATSFVSVVSFSAVSRSAIASLAFAIPFADFSLAVAETCSGSDTAAVPATSVEAEALVASDAVSSRVDAPATCARSTMTAKTAAVSQAPRWFMRAAPLQAQVLGSGEFPPDGRLTTGFADALGAPGNYGRDPVAQKPSAHDVTRPVLGEIHAREGHHEDDRGGHASRPAEHGH